MVDKLYLIGLWSGSNGCQFKPKLKGYQTIINCLHFERRFYCLYNLLVETRLRVQANLYLWDKNWISDDSQNWRNEFVCLSPNLVEYDGNVEKGATETWIWLYWRLLLGLVWISDGMAGHLPSCPAASQSQRPWPMWVQCSRQLRRQSWISEDEDGAWGSSGASARSNACLSACAAIELEYDVAHSLGLSSNEFMQ